ncbi:LacI family DNA-binding transcriptional regulator [Arthrobacter sp. SLBN-112]|uniref:LacI family DNA-binding transcriptional regulator n=1 Tax=Arthrobacter sp. SLBN-112 TaxID=2768452 RepID=UPI0027B23DAD|nr:LacI family DNA-binding transcriptional regulator [Arthrobacter sp. SLBN-112]MDQ0799019.1 DNA-binding LacI/PurR family transcriptional regulator [Arthrobacter sp. SLBN-112]
MEEQTREPQRRPTMMDVAEAAGVSRALVSIVMRGVPGAAESTRQKVFEASRQLGYRPDSRARLLRSTRTRLIGVSFSSSQPFHTEIVDAAYAQADARGYDIALSAVANGRPEKRAAESLLDLGCEALIMISSTLSQEDLERYSGQAPVVSLLRSDVGGHIDAVSSDDLHGIRLAVEHFADLGHARIVHVDGGTAVSARQRRKAFRIEMQRRGLQAIILPGGPGEEDGLRAAEALKDDPPTAVVAFNDRAALGLIEGLRASGLRVPRDVSVLGYDDSQLARLSFVQLSSISQDAPVLAATAVDRAVERVEGTTSAAHVVRTPHLVVRKTTAPPRTAQSQPSWGPVMQSRDLPHDK